jgi:transcriptional regulator with XRE-family HTH domain
MFDALINNKSNFLFDKDETYLSFGKKIYNKRIELGLNLAEVAKLMSFSAGYICQWENDRRVPVLEIQEKVLEQLNHLLKNRNELTQRLTKPSLSFYTDKELIDELTLRLKK